MVYGYYYIGSRTDKKEEFHNCLLQNNVEKIFYDSISNCGIKPNWENLLLCIEKYDTIILPDLISISLNTKKTLKILADWIERGINYRILNSPILDPVGKFSSEVKRVIKILAEYEFSESARKPGTRKRGLKGGRPPGLSKARQILAEEVALLYTKQELSVAEICIKTQIKSRATFYRYLKFMNVSIQSCKARRVNFKGNETHQDFKPSNANMIFFSVEILKKYQDHVIDLMKCHPDIFQLMFQLVARATPKNGKNLK